jgi:catechol 2,3-dioxygenase-like lactoylglutathione lyase family enzyme
MEPIAIHHVSVNVSDLDRALAFYTGTLGGTVREDRPNFSFEGAWINLGTQQVHLIQASVPPNLGQHFAVQVGDLAAVVEELRSSGLELGDPVRVGSDLQTFVNDPDDNVIELHEVGISAR